MRNRGTKAGLILSGTECSLNSRLPSIPLPEFLREVYHFPERGWRVGRASGQEHESANSHGLHLQGLP